MEWNQVFWLCFDLSKSNRHHAVVGPTLVVSATMMWRITVSTGDKSWRWSACNARHSSPCRRTVNNAILNLDGYASSLLHIYQNWSWHRLYCMVVLYIHDDHFFFYLVLLCTMQAIWWWWQAAVPLWRMRDLSHWWSRTVLSLHSLRYVPPNAPTGQPQGQFSPCVSFLVMCYMELVA